MAANHYSSFIDAVAKKRREAGLWTSIVVQVASNQNEPIAPFEQIAQVLEFEFKGHEILIFIHYLRFRKSF